MIEKICVVISGALGLGIVGIYFIRRKLSHGTQEWLIRMLFAAQMAPAVAILWRSDQSIEINAIFLISWSFFSIWVWRVPIFCPSCSELVVRGFQGSKICPACGINLEQV
ncbi:hypothetical protein EBR57_08430 [bacterium]|nr:hypothetical protein [bacterium]